MAPTACRRTVSGNLSLPCTGCFSPFPHGTRSLSVSRECLVLPDGPGGFTQDYTCPALLRVRIGFDTLRVRGCHPLWPDFPDRSARLSSSHVSALLPPDGRNRLGLDYAAFARHYLRYHFCFLFLRVLRCFSSPGSPQLRWWKAFSLPGCPIRVSADQFVFADPRGFSQLITPFFASESLRHPPSALFSFLSICLPPFT